MQRDMLHNGIESFRSHNRPEKFWPPLTWRTKQDHSPEFSIRNFRIASRRLRVALLTGRMATNGEANKHEIGVRIIFDTLLRIHEFSHSFLIVFSCKKNDNSALTDTWEHGSFGNCDKISSHSYS